MRSSAVVVTPAEDDERAVAWVRMFLLTLRSGDDVLRRLAQRELRVHCVAVAPVTPEGRP